MQEGILEMLHNDMEYLFTCPLAISACPLWKTIYSDPLPIFITIALNSLSDGSPLPMSLILRFLVFVAFLDPSAVTSLVFTSDTGGGWGWVEVCEE